MNVAQSKILGVKIDNLSENAILRKIIFFLDEPKFHQIATVNPEFVLEAQRNDNFKDILNNCNLNVADGVGIFFAFIWNLRVLRSRITGADLMMDVLRLANEKKIEIFLACKKEGLSNFTETRDAILKIFPDLNISGDNIDAENITYEIPDTNCKILFCNFGAPHQEFFINSLKSDRIRLAMGVGGAFDFLTGKANRAPKLIQKIGLEWFWRIFQPQKLDYKIGRIKRIFRAVIIFPIKVIFE